MPFCLRHLWQKAMRAPAMDPTSVPADIREAFEAAKHPKARAAIINRFVSKDLGYGDQVAWKPAKLSKFRSYIEEKQNTQQAKGVTWTEMRSDLGKGNLSAGEQVSLNKF